MTNTTLFQRYGDWAIITGAARGLGEAFAIELATQGFNLILVDRLESELQQTVDKLQRQFSVQIKMIVCDLSDEYFLSIISEKTADTPVSLVINNAGISSINAFLNQREEALLEQLHVNTRAVLLLTHHFAKRMCMEKIRGGIIIVSSGAAELPSAYNAHYSATKAYDLKLAESLWHELQPLGIDVLGFMPVATHTPGLINQGFTPSKQAMSADKSVKEALYYLGRTPSVMAGKMDRCVHRCLFILLNKKQRIRLVSREIRKLFSISP